MAICGLSVSAIDRYSSENNNKASNPFSDQLYHIDSAISSTVSALKNESSYVTKVINEIEGYINQCLEECDHKVSSIQSFLSLMTPKVHVTVREEVKEHDADGNEYSKIVEKRKEIDNPYYPQMQNMLRQAEGYRNQLRGFIQQCEADRKYARELETAATNFQSSARDAYDFAGRIAKSTSEHLHSLSQQSSVAAKKLKHAKGAVGPFRTMHDDSGAIDTSGLRSYISNLQSELRSCAADADRLLRTAQDLNMGWNDGVYTKFYNDTVVIRNNVNGIINDLEYMNNALEDMYYRLEDYAAVRPDVRYTSAYFNYRGVNLPWGRSSSSSKSASMMI